MRQGRTTGKSFKPTRFIDFYESPHPVQASIARVIARAEKGLTVYEIQDLAGCSVYSVRSVIKTMQAIKGVYIIDWRRTSSTAVTAVYAVGSLPDADRPTSFHKREIVRRNADRLAAKTIEAIKDSAEALHYKALAHALVPKRDEQEQREVNNRYLNYITGGSYV